MLVRKASQYVTIHDCNVTLTNYTVDIQLYMTAMLVRQASQCTMHVDLPVYNTRRFASVQCT